MGMSEEALTNGWQEAAAGGLKSLMGDGAAAVIDMIKVYVVLEITRKWDGVSPEYMYEASLQTFSRGTLGTAIIGFPESVGGGHFVAETGVVVDYTNVMDLLKKFPKTAPGCGVTHRSMFNNTMLLLFNGGTGFYWIYEYSFRTVGLPFSFCSSYGVFQVLQKPPAHASEMVSEDIKPLMEEDTVCRACMFLVWVLAGDKVEGMPTPPKGFKPSLCTDEQFWYLGDFEDAVGPEKARLISTCARVQRLIAVEIQKEGERLGWSQLP